MAENIINFLLKIMPTLNKNICKKIAIIIEAQSIIFSPKKNVKKNSLAMTRSTQIEVQNYKRKRK